MDSNWFNFISPILDMYMSFQVKQQWKISLTIHTHSIYNFFPLTAAQTRSLSITDQELYFSVDWVAYSAALFNLIKDY